MKILMVEDDLVVAEMYSRPLTQRGYAVTLAHDGSEAFHIIHTQQFDLIILDVMLPSMDGLAMLRRIRVQPKYQSLPILIMTALSDTEIGPQSKAAGATEVLIKTELNPEKLADRIDSYLAAALAARKQRLTPVVQEGQPAPTGDERRKDPDYRVSPAAPTASNQPKLKLAAEPEKPKPVRPPPPPPPPLPAVTEEEPPKREGGFLKRVINKFKKDSE